ncbi:hypothetical protein C9374_008338 [Naegleria lovaniensis]|uniref:Uncharacterized protein n=1 Tax=Naegleria lovaniensis TaxID=51637 RepID=A0AA88GJG1_NAELO|nr:uncharacterized protein C9374_008338 [Naegleria lovaniensis]KAG2378195.1 hypothetical protein C9374_008338 [Naegleria lovaniensis]
MPSRSLMVTSHDIQEERQVILNVIDRLILHGSALFERHIIPLENNSNAIYEDEDNLLAFENATPKNEKKEVNSVKRKIQNHARTLYGNLKQSLHQRNIVACCIDTIMKVNTLIDANQLNVEELKKDLLQQAKEQDFLESSSSEEVNLEFVEPYDVRLSIDDPENWVSRYIFYRYAKTFDVEEGCYTMSRSQFDKFLTHLREVLGERGLGSDILVIKDVLDEDQEQNTDLYGFEDSSIATSVSNNNIVLDVGSVMTELRQTKQVTEHTFLNWFQGVLVLYVMFKYDQ